MFDLTPEGGMGKSMLGTTLGLASDDGALLPFRPRRLSDLEPSSLIGVVPELVSLARARAALTAAKGPLGCERSVRNKLFAGLGDEPTRFQVRYKLGLPPQQRLSAADVFRTGPEADALRKNLRELVLEGEGLESQVPYMEDLLKLSRIHPGTEDFEFGFKALGAIVVQSLDQDWVRVKPDKDGIDAMIAQLDVALSAGCRRVMHHPEYLAFEGVWRAVRLLVTLGERVIGVSCSPSDMMERGSELLRAATAEKPRAAAVLHPIDPRVHGELVRGIAPAFGVPCVFQAHGAVPQALQDEQTRPAVLRAWTAARKSPHARLCLSRILYRLPYGNDVVPVKEFNYEEVPEDSTPEPWLCYGPAAQLVAAAFCDDKRGPLKLESLPIHQYLVDDVVVTAPTVLPTAPVLVFPVASSFGMYQLDYRIGSATVGLAGSHSSGL